MIRARAAQRLYEGVCRARWLRVAPGSGSGWGGAALADPLEADQRAAPREAAAEGLEQDQLAALHAAKAITIWLLGAIRAQLGRTVCACAVNTARGGRAHDQFRKSPASRSG